MNIIEQPLDLGNIVDSEVSIVSKIFSPAVIIVSVVELLLTSVLCLKVKPSTPVLMCSVPGYDASGLVRDLAAEQNKHITSISIGK